MGNKPGFRKLAIALTISISSLHCVYADAGELWQWQMSLTSPFSSGTSTETSQRCVEPDWLQHVKASGVPMTFPGTEQCERSDFHRSGNVYTWNLQCKGMTAEQKTTIQDDAHVEIHHTQTTPAGPFEVVTRGSRIGVCDPELFYQDEGEDG